jgi:hypothetical protein
MKKLTIILLSSLSILFMSCGDTNGKSESVKTSTAATDDDSAQAESSESTDAAKVLNGIQINSTGGVKVFSAVLGYASGDLVPEDNTVSLGEKIKLMVNIEKGWKEIDGKSFIGASETITTDNGTMLLESGDLFASNETGMDATTARIVTLSALLENATPGAQYYIVNFRIWDKKGSGEVTGKYQFKLRTN